METANEIDEQRLLHYLITTKVDDSCGRHTDYFEWNNETEELKNKLKKIGQISIQPNHKQLDAQ